VVQLAAIKQQQQQPARLQSQQLLFAYTVIPLTYFVKENIELYAVTIFLLHNISLSS